VILKILTVVAMLLVLVGQVGTYFEEAEHIILPEQKRSLADIHDCGMHAGASVNSQSPIIGDALEKRKVLSAQCGGSFQPQA
jgi:hypothetical protein